MEGFVDFAITGKVGFAKDYPPTASKGFGSIGFTVQVEGESFQYGQYKESVKPHGIFVWSNYNKDDVNKPKFQMLKARLVKGMNVFVMGAVKPKTNKETGAEELSLDCNWRDIRVSEAPLPPKNRVIASVEVVHQSKAVVQAKYSYRNNLKKEWFERTFVFYTDGYSLADAQYKPRDPMYLEGKIFGISVDGDKVNWILATEVI